MKDTVIFDIDGTIANCEHRVHFLHQKKKDFDRFYAHAHLDEPIDDVIEMVHLMVAAGYKIVFCTGRSEDIRAITNGWLNYQFPSLDYELLMRPSKNYGQDWMIKVDLACKEGLTPDKVFAVFDDRQRVVDAWRDHGYRCYQVVKGDY